MNILQLVAAVSKLARVRASEPSTWAGAGAGLVALAQMSTGPYQPVILAAAGLASALAVVLGEKYGAQPAPAAESPGTGDGGGVVSAGG